MKKCLIFDVDGTLWDASENILIAFNEAIYNELGIENYLTMEVLNSIMGLEIKEIANVFFPDMNENEAIELTNRCMAYESEYLSQHGGKLYNHVIETLEVLSKEYELMIVTNANHPYVNALFTSYPIGQYFIDFETNGNTGLSKDKNIRLILERNGYDTGIYIGDTMKDYLACQKANIPMIFASYGFGDVKDPWKQIDSFHELLDVLKLI